MSCVCIIPPINTSYLLQLFLPVYTITIFAVVTLSRAVKTASLYYHSLSSHYTTYSTVTFRYLSRSVCVSQPRASSAPSFSRLSRGNSTGVPERSLKRDTPRVSPACDAAAEHYLGRVRSSSWLDRFPRVVFWSRHSFPRASHRSAADSAIFYGNKRGRAGRANASGSRRGSVSELFFLTTPLSFQGNIRNIRVDSQAAPNGAKIRRVTSGLKFNQYPLQDLQSNKSTVEIYRNTTRKTLGMKQQVAECHSNLLRENSSRSSLSLSRFPRRLRRLRGLRIHRSVCQPFKNTLDTTQTCRGVGAIDVPEDIRLLSGCLSKLIAVQRGALTTSSSTTTRTVPESDKERVTWIISAAPRAIGQRERVRRPDTSGLEQPRGYLDTYQSVDAGTPLCKCQIALITRSYATELNNRVRIRGERGSSLGSVSNSCIKFQRV